MTAVQSKLWDLIRPSLPEREQKEFRYEERVSQLACSILFRSLDKKNSAYTTLSSALEALCPGFHICDQIPANYKDPKALISSIVACAEEAQIANAKGYLERVPSSEMTYEFLKALSNAFLKELSEKNSSLRQKRTRDPKETHLDDSLFFDFLTLSDRIFIKAHVEHFCRYLCSQFCQIHDADETYFQKAIDCFHHNTPLNDKEKEKMQGIIEEVLSHESLEQMLKEIFLSKVNLDNNDKLIHSVLDELEQIDGEEDILVLKDELIQMAQDCLSIQSLCQTCEKYFEEKDFFVRVELLTELDTYLEPLIPNVNPEARAVLACKYLLQKNNPELLGAIDLLEKFLKEKTIDTLPLCDQVEKRLSRLPDAGLELYQATFDRLYESQELTTELISSIEILSKTLPNETMRTWLHSTLFYDTPKDGSCLFSALIIALFIPLLSDKKSFLEMYRKIFGQYGQEKIFYQILTSYDGTAASLERFSPFKIYPHRLRQLLVVYLQAHPDDFSDFMYEGLENYCKNMQQPTSFGGGIEIRAFCDLLEVSVEVSLPEPNATPPKFGSGNRTLFLHLEDLHYTVHKSSFPLFQGQSKPHLLQTIMEMTYFPQFQFEVDATFKRDKTYCSAISKAEQNGDHLDYVITSFVSMIDDDTARRLVPREGFIINLLKALREDLRSFAPKLKNAALVLLGSTDEAEEIAKQTALHICRKDDRIRLSIEIFRAILMQALASEDKITQAMQYLKSPRLRAYLDLCKQALLISKSISFS